MILTTEQVIDYFHAFTRLDGYPRSVEIRGNPQIIIESYDLSPKVKWRCITNRHLLRPIKEAYATEKDKGDKTVREFILGLDQKMDPEEKGHLVAQKEKEVNDGLMTMLKMPNDIPGLLKLPGVGIRIRQKDPGLIAILDLLMTHFLEGEPDYGQPKQDAKKADSADRPTDTPE